MEFFAPRLCSIAVQRRATVREQALDEHDATYRCVVAVEESNDFAEIVRDRLEQLGQTTDGSSTRGVLGELVPGRSRTRGFGRGSFAFAGRAAIGAGAARRRPRRSRVHSRIKANARSRWVCLRTARMTVSPNRRRSARGQAGGHARPTIRSMMLPTKTAASASHCPTTLWSVSVCAYEGWSAARTALADRGGAPPAGVAILGGRLIAATLSRGCWSVV